MLTFPPHPVVEIRKMFEKGRSDLYYKGSTLLEEKGLRGFQRAFFDGQAQGENGTAADGAPSYKSCRS